MPLMLLVGMVHAAELVEADAVEAAAVVADSVVADSVAAEAASAPPVEELGASKPSGSSGSSSSGSSGSSKSSGSSSSSSSSATSFKKGKIWGWTYRPYVTPGGGLSITNGATSVTGAVDVGIRYHKDKWKGDLSAGGSYSSGSSLQGFDVHGGNEFGRREKYWGLSAGLMLFYNAYGETVSTAALDPSVGLDVPVELILGPKKYYVYGDITPSFLFNKDRHVEGLPFGDELEWGVGAGLKLKWITAEAGFNSRITTVGVINTPTLTVSISGLD